MNMRTQYEKFLTKSVKREGDFIKVGRGMYSMNTLPEYLIKQNLCDYADAATLSGYIFENLTEEKNKESLQVFDINGYIRGKLNSESVIYNFDGTWSVNGRIINTKKFISELRLELYEMGHNKKDGLIDDVLDIWESEQIDKILIKTKEHVLFDPLRVEDGEEALNDFIHCISSDSEERNKYHKVVLKHIIWCIKRKLAELPVEHHMLINAYGETRSGKSRAVQELLSPLKGVIYQSGTLKMFSDVREMFLLQKYYVIMLEELEGGQRADVNALKRVISSDIVSYRIMRSNREMVGANRATFIGTSNNRIKDTIFDPSSAGRYWEINCLPKVVFKQNWDIINKIDYMAIWQSIDEHKPSPILSEIDEIHRIQKKDFKAMTNFESWLDEKMMSPGNPQLEDGNWISVGEIIEIYSWGNEEFAKKMSKNAASRELNTLGYCTDRKITEDGRVTMFYIKQDKRVSDNLSTISGNF